MKCEHCGAEKSGCQHPTHHQEGVPQGGLKTCRAGDPAAKLRGLTIKELIILIVIIVILVWLAISNEFGGTPRSPVSRSKGDQRTMTIALETYFLDHNVYPAWSLKKEENAYGGLRDKKGLLARIPTFRLSNGTKLESLTTPVSYVTALYADPFSPMKGATFGYWNDSTTETVARGYIIWSAGPDGVYDLTIDNIAQAYDAKSEKISDMLLNLTYDPSNGTGSRGDVYRVKQ